MSLSPIQMFQNNGQNSITSLLQGGPNAVARIMDQAIQIGRQMSDKQLAQERDMMAMRQQETSLMQRRAENLQQGNENAMRFARSAFESDRRYTFDQQGRDFVQNRTTSQDLFSNEIADRGMDLREKEFESDEEVRRKEEQERVNAQTLFANKTASNAPIEDIQGVTDEDKYRARDMLSADAKDPRLTLDQRKEAVVRGGEVERSLPEGAVSGDTPAGRRAARSLEMREEDRAKKLAAEEAGRLITPGSKAFVSPSVWGLKGAGGDPEKLTPEVRAEAAAYNKDPVAAEMGYALNQPDIEKYASPPNMTLSGADKEQRRKLWRIAHGQGGGSTSGGAVSLIPGI
jgi:DNA-binding transcriptional regulator/RsmH inhibitor MraZ